MAERGNASVTAMLRHTASVSCATRRACLPGLRKSITRFPCQKVVRMIGTTLFLCASHAMQGFMQREVTDGTEERVTRMSKDETYRYFTENQFLLCV